MFKMFSSLASALGLERHVLDGHVGVALGRDRGVFGGRLRWGRRTTMRRGRLKLLMQQ